jgi:hypothetical protein
MSVDTSVSAPTSALPALVEEVNVRFAELKQSRRQEKEQMKALKKALMKQIAYRK